MTADGVKRAISMESYKQLLNENRVVVGAHITLLVLAILTFLSMFSAFTPGLSSSQLLGILGGAMFGSLAIATLSFVPFIVAGQFAKMRNCVPQPDNIKGHEVL